MTKKERTKQFGLVGKNIDYSFSRTYFKNKFDSENKVGYSYVNFDLQSIDNIKEMLKYRGDNIDMFEENESDIKRD